MTSWDERALEEAKNEHARNRLYDLEKSRLTTFVEGARWQREALLSDEAVERAARALEENFNPDKYPILAAMFRDYAATALRAAIGDDDE